MLYDNMKQAVIKRLLKREDSTLRQFEDFAGFYGFKPILCRPYQGQTTGKVERTVQFVRDNFMVGIKYNSLADLNGQAMDAENVLLEQGKVIDFPLNPSDLSRYDEVLYDRIYHGQAEGKPGSP